jgi:histone acetyltransferase (RNA polymerase elongator complex component)
MTETKTKEMIKTSEHTNIAHETKIEFNAPHVFGIYDNEGEVIDVIKFQKGPIKEAGVNGVTNEDLLHMVKLRLEGFQNSDFACEENGEALLYVNAALNELNKRTQKRVARGVEGTHVV